MSAITAALMNKRINKLDRELDYKAPIFGVYWDKGESPQLIRTHDAQGMEANVGVDGQWAQNDFDSAPIFGQMGEVEDTYGNRFIRIPRLYIRKHIGPDFHLVGVTTRPLPGFYLPWCFWDFEKSVELPYVDIGKYNTSLSDDGKLQSVAGVPPLVHTNIVQFRNYAQANNVGGLRGYQQLDVHTYDILQTLMFIEFATLDMQSVMRGFVDGRYGVEADVAIISETATNRIVLNSASAAGYRVGQTISVGTSRYGTNVFYGRSILAIEDYDADNKAIVFDGEPVDIAAGNLLQNTGAVSGFSDKVAASSGSIGSNAEGKYPCMYRGIENPYGSVWQWVDGVNINYYQSWVCKDAEQYASNLFASPYEMLGYVNSDTNGYVMQMGFDPAFPFAEFPVEVGGTASTYYSDYYYRNTGQRVARVGGSLHLGSSAGPSYWALADSSSYAHVYAGGRLVKKAL